MEFWGRAVTSSPPASLEADRAAFEHWLRGRGIEPGPAPNREYSDARVQAMWDAWRAASAVARDYYRLLVQDACGFDVEELEAIQRQNAQPGQ